MSAKVLKFPQQLPPKVIAYIDTGMHWAAQEVATGRRQRVLSEADELLRRAAKFREYVRDCGRDEPLMVLMAEHHALFPTRPDFHQHGDDGGRAA